MTRRRPLILNAALVGAIVLLAVRFHNDWILFEAAHQAGAVEPQPETSPALSVTDVPIAAPEDWTDIPSRNPFSFDRNDIAILEPQPEAPAAPAPPAGPKPFLFGTMLLGANRLAMIGPGQAGNRNSRYMRVGETINGWTIVDILDRSVVIEFNSTRETIIMNDPSAQLQRDHSRTDAAPSAAPPVTSITAPPPARTPAASTSQPASGQQTTRRRVTQVTPFGTRVIEVEEPQQ
jgi:hypothetical protein